MSIDVGKVVNVTVDLGAVAEAVTLSFDGSVAVAVNVIVPSSSVLVSIVAVQVPPVTVAATGSVWCPSPSLATTLTVASDSTLPPIVTDAALAMLICVGIVVSVIVDFVVVVETVAVLFVVSVAVTVKVIVPSSSELASSVAVHVPSVTVAVTGSSEWPSASLATTLTVAFGSTVPLTVTLPELAMLIGVVIGATVTVVFVVVS